MIKTTKKQKQLLADLSSLLEDYSRSNIRARIEITEVLEYGSRSLIAEYDNALCGFEVIRNDI